MHSILTRLLRSTAIVAVCVSAVPTLADTTNYLMWQMPSSGPQFPIYVKSGKNQSAYLYSALQESIIGDYDSSTSGTYELYYQSSETQWNSCKLILSSGSVDNAKTTCAGAVINKPVGNSNVYTLALAATAWPKTVTAPSHVTPNYGSRSITFKNDTAYDAIRIGQVCTVDVNPHNKKCQNSQKRWKIKQGETKVFNFDSTHNGGLTGLDSTAFTVTAYKTGGKWVKTGGYGTGQTPYATKVEMTALPVPQQTGAGGDFPAPAGSTNFDISVVDGYNISAKAYPIGGGYCTFTVPPENSNVLGAGYYDKSNVLAFVDDSKKLCDASSQLPTGYSGNNKKWSLTKTSKHGDYQGCLSPCTYAKINGKVSQDLFCCTGSYDSPATCDQQPKTVIGANNSSYVTNLDSSKATHVYRFAYDDAIGDFACPADTSIAVVFGSESPREIPGSIETVLRFEIPKTPKHTYATIYLDVSDDGKNATMYKDKGKKVKVEQAQIIFPHRKADKVGFDLKFQILDSEYQFHDSSVIYRDGGKDTMMIDKSGGSTHKNDYFDSAKVKNSSTISLTLKNKANASRIFGGFLFSLIKSPGSKSVRTETDPGISVKRKGTG